MAGALVTVAEIRLAQRDHAGARGALPSGCGLVSQAGPRRVGGDLDEPRPAGRGAGRAATRRRRRSTRRRRRPTRCRWARRRGDPVTARGRPRPRRVERGGDRRSGPRRHPPADSRTDRRRTASSSPMSTPSPRTGVAIVRRRGGRSAVGSLRRWRAKPPSVRSRHVLMRRCTATPSPRSGRASPSPMGGHASCWRGSKRPG